MKSSRWWFAPKALRVFFLIALVVMMGAVTTTTTGCGGGGIFAALGCIPCEILIIAGIGITLLFEELTENDCDCDRPPPVPPPPPPIPPPPPTNWFGVAITADSECPIDGIFIDDPADPFDMPVWVFGGPQAYPDPDDNAPPGSMIGLPAEQMIWPDRGPTYPGWRTLWQSVQLVHFADSVGNFDRFMTASGAVNVTIKFENTQELALGPQFIDHGTTFVVRWTNVDGTSLEDIRPQPLTVAPLALQTMALVAEGEPQAMTWTTSFKTSDGTYVLECHRGGVEIVDILP